MSAQPIPGLTPEQYLEIERAAEFKSEYYCGTMYATAGGTGVHGLIIVRVTGLLFQKLDGGPCSIFSSDVRLRVSKEGLYTYPDLTVVCGAPKYADDQKDTLLNPSLIVEVLSKSTEAHDRGFKFAQYRSLESLQEYLLVSQTEMRVEKYLRRPAGKWELTDFAGPDAVCRLESLGCEIPVADIYRNVPLEAEAPGASPAV
jgi:Uma2 family endonuclease